MNNEGDTKLLCFDKYFHEFSLDDRIFGTDEIKDIHEYFSKHIMFFHYVLTNLCIGLIKVNE